MTITDQSIETAKVYTDIQGLQRINYEYRNNPQAAKKEVAQQFESILIQMVMHSMRDANKVLASDLFGNEQMEFYQDMFDKQLALVMASTGTGLAAMIEKNIDQQTMAAKQPTNTLEKQDELPKALPESAMRESYSVVPYYAASAPQPETTFTSSDDFIRKLWPSAQFAASLIGATPEFLLAQAALETNWGKNIVSNGKEGALSHNLFNIKADSSWDKDVVMMDSLEQKNGVIIKEKSAFRSYDSFIDSFMDYVNFLQQNGRYSDALAKAPDPKQFAHALQDAGYATDQNYADKILRIYSSRSFQNSVAKMKDSA